MTTFTQKDNGPFSTSRPRGRGMLLVTLCCLLALSRPLSAAILLVTNLADSGPGTLRQTLAVATNGDSIKFTVTGTIFLTTGRLTVNHNVAIEGPGETNLVIDAQQRSQIFFVPAGTTAQIFDLTVTNGINTATGLTGAGAGIRNEGNLTLTRVTVIECTAAMSLGGGIYNAGNLTLIQTTVVNNAADVGGGIADTGTGRLILDRSAIVANMSSVPESASGGGIEKLNGTLLATNSTISDNLCGDGDGGGIQAFCYVRLESCTVVSNRVFGSQISSNTFSGRGGGLFLGGPNGVAEIHNTLIADNSATTALDAHTISLGPDIFGRIQSQGWNLIGNPTNATISGVLTGNIIGKDPLVGPLQFNGGPTPTHALLAGSPAIDRGSPFAGSFPSGDQRDVPRPQDGNGDLRFITDIGAYEVETVIPSTIPGDIIVTSSGDSGPGTLRAALFQATNGTRITFAITGNIFVHSQLIINHNVLIEGPGASNLFIRNADLSRVFLVAAGTTAQIFDLTVANGLTLTSGSLGAGGGIRNEGNLTLTRVTVTECATTFSSGGGVYNLGNLTLVQSTIALNAAVIGADIADAGTGNLILDRSAIVANLGGVAAGASGGGIEKTNGVLLATNSTIADNFVGDGDGGGIQAFCYVRLESCTVVSNVASGVQIGPNLFSGRGGGLFLGGPKGVAEIHNTLIADNSATTTIVTLPPSVLHLGPDVFGRINSQGWNLIKNPTNATISGVLTGNIIGQDPLLGPLAENGGPTPTHALLFGSPAIDAGSPFPGSFPNTDQRGLFIRPQDGDGDNVFITDIGAYEAPTVIPGLVATDDIGDH